MVKTQQRPTLPGGKGSLMREYIANADASSHPALNAKKQLLPIFNEAWDNSGVTELSRAL